MHCIKEPCTCKKIVSLIVTNVELYEYLWLVEEVMKELQKWNNHIVMYIQKSITESKNCGMIWIPRDGERVGEAARKIVTSIC